jgi:hypothetical protein
MREWTACHSILVSGGSGATLPATAALRLARRSVVEQDAAGVAVAPAGAVEVPRVHR